MGLSRQASIEALQATNGHLERAVDRVLRDPSLSASSVPVAHTGPGRRTAGKLSFQHNTNSTTIMAYNIK
jgi:hypothetical protein